MNIAIEELKSTIKNFISSTSFADTSQLTEESLIFRDGYFDSMGFMSLISFLENNMQISIVDTDLVEDNFESINAMVKFILKKKSIA